MSRPADAEYEPSAASRWAALDLRQLATLQAIAREGSFKAAAHALGYTPSAVSQQIASLERIVGVQVIAREQGRQALGLTEAGRILLRHLAPIEAQLGAAQADLEALAGGMVGTLRVGSFESVRTRLLPDVVAALGKRLPHLRVDVHETLSDLEHVARVERGELDVTFTLDPLPPGPFAAKVVLRDPWVLVVQANSELARRPPGSLTLEAVAGLPLVCFRASRAMGAVPATFAAAAVGPTISSRSDYNDAVQELAAVGRGVALLPRLCVNPRDERTKIVELPGVFPPREIVVAWHSDRDQSEGLASFVALAADIGAGLGDQPGRRSQHGGEVRQLPGRRVAGLARSGASATSEPGTRSG